MTAFRDPVRACRHLAAFERIGGRAVAARVAGWALAAPLPDAALDNLAAWARRLHRPARRLTEASDAVGRWVALLAGLDEPAAAAIQASVAELEAAVAPLFPGSPSLPPPRSPTLNRASVIGWRGPSLLPALATMPDQTRRLLADGTGPSESWWEEAARWVLEPTFDLAAAYSRRVGQTVAENAGACAVFALESLAWNEATPLRPLALGFSPGPTRDDELATIRSRLATMGVPGLEARPLGEGWTLLADKGHGVETMHSAEHRAFRVARRRRLGGRSEQEPAGIDPGSVSPGACLSLKRHLRASTPAQYHRRLVNLDDVEWLVVLAVIRGVPTGPEPSTPRYLVRLMDGGLIDDLERDALESAWGFLSEVRIRLALLGVPLDVVPENPDRLLLLSRSMGFSGNDDFLATFESHRDLAHGLFTTVSNRLVS